MMRNTKDEDLKQYFQIKMERARYLLNCVEQRRKTIVKVTEAIVEMQSRHFLYQESLRPMSLEDIARETELPESFCVS